MALTPLPIPAIRVLSIICTVGASMALLMSFPETDSNSREHVFSTVTRQLNRGVNAATKVDEAEAAAIRRAQDRKP